MKLSTGRWPTPSDDDRPERNGFMSINEEILQYRFNKEDIKRALISLRKSGEPVQIKGGRDLYIERIDAAAFEDAVKILCECGVLFLEDGEPVIRKENLPRELLMVHNVKNKIADKIKQICEELLEAKGGSFDTETDLNSEEPEVLKVKSSEKVLEKRITRTIEKVLKEYLSDRLAADIAKEIEKELNKMNVTLCGDN